MKIIKIEKIQFKKNIFRIFFEDNESLMFSADTIVKFGLKIGLNISQDTYKEIISYNTLNKVVYDALILLSKRSYSAKSLQTKLLQRGYESQKVDEAVKRLEELNYVNDEKFANTYAVYLSEKGKGEFAVKAELEKQGIERNLIKDVLAKIKTDIDPYEQIAKILKVKFKNFNGKNKNEVRIALTFFLRRGFAYESIVKVFKTHIKEIKDISIE
ncbi:MAG: recombination regulator RecX [Endomicrobium sp.]|jgi:regulatory protein|nr:recombination regulator RecX [Endomicrobium sp.]